MAPSISRVSSGALLLALAYNARPVNADFWEDVDNCKLVLDDLPIDLTTDFCHDWTYGYQPDEVYETVTGYPVTITEYPEPTTCESKGYSTSTPGPYSSYQSQYNGSTTQSYDSYSYSDSTYEPSSGYYTVSTSDTSSGYYTESTPGSSMGYQTTEAPYQPATYVPGGYDVTVTSTSWTTYWTTVTVYDDYPTATPAPYRRHARDVKERAAWCVDRPCRLVQYDDDTIVEACKQYLVLEPVTSTFTEPGYTATVTSYPTDCETTHVPDYATETPEVYPTETDYPEYATETDVYPTETDYPEYSEETPDVYPADPEYPESPEETPYYEPEPAPYAEDELTGYEDTPYYEAEPEDELTGYEDTPYYEAEPEDELTGYEDTPYYEPEPAPYAEDELTGYEDTGDYQDSGETQPAGNSFDNNYSGPDGPLPWDDVDQTSELADAIEAGGLENAVENLGLEDAAWNALPADFPQ